MDSLTEGTYVRHRLEPWLGVGKVIEVYDYSGMIMYVVTWPSAPAPHPEFTEEDHFDLRQLSALELLANQA